MTKSTLSVKEVADFMKITSLIETFVDLFDFDMQVPFVHENTGFWAQTYKITPTNTLNFR